ncbi:MAG: DUF1330 domain-containing protein [Alphaproteobacteria bacterium]|jgi:uncharacterized protein (DUF1330 family)
MSAYLIAEIEVQDVEAYTEYTAQTPGLVARHGGTFIIRGGTTKALEGDWAGRLAVMEFPDMTALETFWNDPDYRKIVGIRHKHSTGRVVAVEGV